LRHAARKLYLDVVDGQVPGVRLRRIASLAAAASTLGQAGLIVQALGYVGRTPEIRIGGRLLRTGFAGDLLRTDELARVCLDGVQARLSALRVEPTPKHLRDHAAYGSTLYDDLAERILTSLETETALAGRTSTR
jgi:hypothetical protein